MKYNDNGTYKDIYVKAFDTLPVGAIVEFDGQTIPNGWTDIGNNKIQKTSQYIENGANLSNEYGTSDENGYTQEYINTKVSQLLPNNLIRLETVKLTESITLAAFSSQYVEVTVPAIDGYTPWLAYEVSGYQNSSIRGYSNPVNLSTMRVSCWVNNFANTSQTVSGVDFKVMYIKNIQ